MSDSKQYHYLDYAATTPMDPEVLATMMPYLQGEFGNASSLHQAGLDSRVAVDRAQAQIAHLLNCDWQEVYFTSGATESDNMAILGVWRACRGADLSSKYHIIVSQIEHDAILESARQAEKEGAEVTYLPVTAAGLVEVETLRAAIKDNTILISIMYANNEVGTIQPIAEIGKLISELNKTRAQKIYFHTDATQALPYYSVDVNKLGVDLLSLSAHKIYGPKGIGAFFMRRGTPLAPLLYGGHQQDNIRPGTYNVPAIVGFGRAGELLPTGEKLQQESDRVAGLRDYLKEKIVTTIPDVIINGDLNHRLPGNINFTFRGVEGESILLMLSEKNVAISTGSACSSGSLSPSHVLTAMGIKPELAHGSVRVSIGRFTTKKDLDVLIKALPEIISRLREMSPIKNYA